VNVPREVVEKAVQAARDLSERILFIGALLGRATALPVIIVGGSALVIQTSGQTVSADIDVVTERGPAEIVVESWGFRRSGRVWRRDDWNIDIDLVGRDLEGNMLRLTTISTPYGSVQVIGIEDLLVKRLAELKHWPTSKPWREELVRHVYYLLERYSEMDQGYLASVLKRDDVQDILADFLAHRVR
jgi:hypothetical protein